MSSKNDKLVEKIKREQEQIVFGLENFLRLIAREIDIM